MREFSRMNGRDSVWIVLLTLVCVWLAPSMVVAQTTDTAILGTVMDPSGAAIVGAQIEISQPATGFMRAVATDSTGYFEVRYLLPGDYVVTSMASGFSTKREAGLVLQVGQQARISITLQVGTVVESVDVSGQLPLLQTESGVLGHVVTAERIASLPLNGRRFLDLANLTPGVTLTSSAAQQIVMANGTRNTTMQMSFNGITAVANRWAVGHMFPSVDALQEFKVQAGNYSAEYGGNGGANINVQLKSGTNGFHGTLYEFLRNDKLDARAYFRPAPLPKDMLRRNQYGAVISGPIRKDKTFFMAAWEGQRETVESVSSTAVLTPAQRTGDFSAVSTRIVDPTTGTQFLNNIIPSNRINPVSLDFANKFMPLPNQSGSQNLSFSSLSTKTWDQLMTRLDHRLGSDQLSGHFMFQESPTTSLGANNILSSGHNRTFNFGAQWVHPFSPTWLNEARFGYYRKITFSAGPRTNTNFKPSDWGINGMTRGNGEQLPGFPIITITGYLGMNDVSGGPGDQSRTWQIVDNLSKFVGKHGLKMGVDMRYLMLDAATTNWPLGQINFTGELSGNGAADYILGYPQNSLTPEGFPVTATRSWRYFFYFQDDWRATPNLTLNLGVRYDLLGMPLDKNGTTRTLRWDLDASGPVLWPEPGVVTPLWENEHWHVAPRLGFAYRLGTKSVVRGGYGIFTAANQFDNMNALQLNPPAAGSITVINTKNPLATMQNPFPAALLPPKPLWNVTSLLPDRFRVNPYIQNWNFTVSRQITGTDVLDVAYAGSKGTFLDTSHVNWNSPDPGPGDIQARRPYPQWGSIRMLTTDGNSIYHALQGYFEHRFHKGLSATVSYNWSHMIDDQMDETNGQRSLAQNPRARGRAYERANSYGRDLRHRLVVGYVWDLPFAKSWKGVASQVFSGWSASGLVTLQSGTPYWITQSGDSQNVNDGRTGHQRPNMVPGQDPVLSPSERTPDRWFNTAAFSRSTLQYGNSPRNPAGPGPGMKTWDASLSKSFKLPMEGHRLQFRGEFFNAFNTPQFGPPGNTLGTSQFGRVTSTVGNARLIQFGLKYDF